jgi:hypothetical protein
MMYLILALGFYLQEPSYVDCLIENVDKFEVSRESAADVARATVVACIGREPYPNDSNVPAR